MMDDLAGAKRSPDFYLSHNSVEVTTVEFYISPSSPASTPGVSYLIGIEFPIAAIPTKCGTELCGESPIWPNAEFCSAQLAYQIYLHYFASPFTSAFCRSSFTSLGTLCFQ